MKEGETRPIAVDAMGSDLGPTEIVRGVALALGGKGHAAGIDSLILVGREDEVREAVRTASLEGDPRIRIHPATEVIGMDEKPLASLKKKKDSSMVRAIELVKEGEASALLSCGNTGSLMAGGTLRIRPLAGIERPALATIIPTRTGRFILIDAGANPEPTPYQLVQNAILGENFARVVLETGKPRVGLLTIGTEEGKGSARIQETHEFLKELDHAFLYEGLIEGFQVFENRVDVVVCDGFVGNIVLKVCESLFKMLTGFVKDELSASLVRKAGALLAMGAFRDIKTRLNPEQYGAAPFLGLKAPVFKAHGSSDRKAIAGALDVIADALRHDLTEHILEDVREAEKILDARAKATGPTEKEIATGA